AGTHPTPRGGPPGARRGGGPQRGLQAAGGGGAGRQRSPPRGGGRGPGARPPRPPPPGRKRPPPPPPRADPPPRPRVAARRGGTHRTVSSPHGSPAGRRSRPEGEPVSGRYRDPCSWRCLTTSAVRGPGFRAEAGDGFTVADHTPGRPARRGRGARPLPLP